MQTWSRSRPRWALTIHFFKGFQFCQLTTLISEQLLTQIKPYITKVTNVWKREREKKLVLFSGHRLQNSKLTDQSETIQKSVFIPWTFKICGQFPLNYDGRHPRFDLAEMMKLLWNQTVRSVNILARVKAPLKTFEYWKRYYHTPVRFLLFLQQQSLHLLRCRCQRLFTPLMYRRTNLINLPRRHIFISTIWDRVRKLGCTRPARL